MKNKHSWATACDHTARSAINVRIIDQIYRNRTATTAFDTNAGPAADSATRKPPDTR